MYHYPGTTRVPRVNDIVYVKGTLGLVGVVLRGGTCLVYRWKSHKKCWDAGYYTASSNLDYIGSLQCIGADIKEGPWFNTMRS